jgi:hypothetical protein
MLTTVCLKYLQSKLDCKIDEKRKKVKVCLFYNIHILLTIGSINMSFKKRHPKPRSVKNDSFIENFNEKCYFQEIVMCKSQWLQAFKM